MALETLGMKAVVLGFALASATILRGPPESLASLVGQWDASSYLALASHGYDDPAVPPQLIVYPPLFPALIAALALLVRDVAVSALVVTAIGAIAAVLLLSTLARREFGAEHAHAAGLALLVFPTAYVLHLPFSESVFIAFVLGAFIAARDDRWAAAGALGALATLTRTAGAILLPALAAQALLSWRSGGFRRAWLWLALIPAAVAAELVLVRISRGDPLVVLTAYRTAWGKQLDLPWVGFGHLVGFATDPANAWPLWALEIVFVIVGLVAIVVSAVRLAPPYTIWVAGNWLLFVSTSVIASVPRYTLTLFPLFLLVAPLMRSRGWRLAIVVTGLALQLFLVARFATRQWAY